jgi:hypothetical protein
MIGCVPKGQPIIPPELKYTIQRIMQIKIGIRALREGHPPNPNQSGIRHPARKPRHYGYGGVEKEMARRMSGLERGKTPASVGIAGEKD